MTTDHVALAIARLPQQFRGKPNIEAWLSALVRPLNDVQQAIDDLRRMRRIDDATGVWLDRIGKKVVQLRGDLDDDTYRRYLRARIATSKSRGTPRELVAIARAILGAGVGRVVLDDQGYASVAISIDDYAMTEDIANALISFLAVAAAAGVRVVLETFNGDDEDTFAYSVATFADEVLTPGMTSFDVVDASDFPASGSVVIDAGLATEQTVAYGSRTDTHLSALTPPVASGHALGAAVSIATEPGAGFGSYADSDVGGQLADARDEVRTPDESPEGEIYRTLSAIVVAAAGTVA